jgi:hypothetical protein
MSKGFVSIWCAGCTAGYRNRQALFRHQKKSGCSGSLHKSPQEEPLYANNSEEIVIVPSTDLVLHPNFFEDLHLGGDAVKGRSLADITDTAQNGLGSPLINRFAMRSGRIWDGALESN